MSTDSTSDTMHRSLWAGLFTGNYEKIDSSNTEHAKHAQTKQINMEGSIWNCISSGHVQSAKYLIDHQPAVVRSRGAVGELPVHMCFLLGGTSHQIEIFKYMIEKDPDLLYETYNGADYLGENLLHIAIILKREDLVKMLFEIESKQVIPNVGISKTPPRRERKKESVENVKSSACSLLSARATGSFFKVGKACYYGEFPLAFAICTNQFKMFDTLIGQGADMNVQDSNGNNILHVLVHCNNPGAYGFFKKAWIKKHCVNGDHDKPDSSLVVPWLQRNKDGFTPFTLSAKLGHKKIFEYLLDESKLVLWTYGPVTCVAYPLDELDDLEYKGNNEKDDGAFEIIINNSHYDLLRNPLISKLVETKWKAFAERILWDRFIWFCVYVIVLTAFAMQRPHVISSVSFSSDKSAVCAADISPPINHSNPALLLLYMLSALLTFQEFQAVVSVGFLSYILTTGSVMLGRLRSWCCVLYVSMIWYFEFFRPFPESEAAIFYALLLLLLAGAAWKAIREFQEILSSGFISYISATGSAFMENALSLLHAFCVFLFAGLHFLESPWEKYALSVSSFVCVFYSFIFLLAVEFTGPMVVMLYGVMKGDVIRFCIVFTTFVLACANAFFVFEEDRGLAGFRNAIISCFDASSGMDFKNLSFLKGVALLSITVIMQILLMNLLIAMIGDTYANTKDECHRKWEMERARVIFAVENEMSVSERKDAKNMYFVNIRGKMYLQVEEVNETFWDETLHDDD